MNGVTVSLVSADQFFREGLKALLEENGYAVNGSVADCRELDAVVSLAETPVLVLIDVAREVDAAADQFRYLNDTLPGVTIVAFGEERDGDWLTVCEDYDVSALLRKQVSFKALLHCLELVMIGEKVLPANVAPSTRDRACESAAAGEVNGRRRAARRATGETIPCMTCRQPFETQDRRSNRICSSCKTRMGRIGSGIEHTLHT
ncbi:MAG: hypothetical protein MJE12_24865 [Alphaproteobacteria bacterium]|nr:hypothetical protein [Alphaproteobacteria bacterium]